MMKKNIKKILGSALALALFLGNFTGTGFAVVKADSREMPIYVIDEETLKPVEGVYLMLESTSKDAEDIIFDEPTDEEGYVLYEPLTLKSNVTYLLKTTKDSGYTYYTQVEVTGGRNYYGPYIQTVNGEEYTGEDVNFYVEDNGGEKPVVSEISSISSLIKDAHKNGGATTITVNGRNLLEKAYCQLWYATSIGRQELVSDRMVTMTGDDAQKKFIVVLPAVSRYPEASTWIVRVSLDGGEQGWDAVYIPIMK